MARKVLNVHDSDNYEWETHIFFDDAFEPDNTGRFRVVNQFVKLLVEQVDEQGKKWYGPRKMKVPSPIKYPTPYGGRLVWTLPGDTKITCHLKGTWWWSMSRFAKYDSNLFTVLEKILLFAYLLKEMTAVYLPF